MSKPDKSLMLYLLLVEVNGLIEDKELHHHSLIKSIRTITSFVEKSDRHLNEHNQGAIINKLAPHNFSKIIDSIDMDVLMTPESVLTIEKI